MCSSYMRNCLYTAAVGGREKRSLRAQTTRHWLSNMRVMVTWEHPDNHSQVVAYRFFHVAVNISDWEPKLSFRYLELPRTRLSVVLNNVSIHDFHIFTLDTVYETSIYGDILLDSKLIV